MISFVSIVVSKSETGLVKNRYGNAAFTYEM